MKPDRLDWECYLLPVALLDTLKQLPVHELCRTQLDHVVIPAAARSPEAIRRELRQRAVGAVSWRWSRARPADATLETLAEWSPMDDRQLQRMKTLAARLGCRYLWVDWCCIPQVSAETMRFINASHDVYSSAEHILFVPRLKELPRQGWPVLSPDDARSVVEMVARAAGSILTSGTFDQLFGSVVADRHRIKLMESALEAAGGPTPALSAQLDSVLQMLRDLLTGNAMVYPTFDYYARAWTVAERLAAFHPSETRSVTLGRMHSAGDAMLYSIATFWRSAQTLPPEPRVTRQPPGAGELARAVYMRAIDASRPDAPDIWRDMNHLVQLAPLTAGVWSEVAALAVICLESILDRGPGASDGAGSSAATTLGACVAFTAIAVTYASFQEETSQAWFRKYLHFQAGSLYGASIRDDLLLAVYRSCGIPEQPTAVKAIRACHEAVFAAPKRRRWREPPWPDIERLCLEALRHDDLLTHMASAQTSARTLDATDFAPMLPSVPSATITLADWHGWLQRTGLVVSWWPSHEDATRGDSESPCIDVEHLYCEDVHRLAGGTLDDLFRATATVVYRLAPIDDRRWRLLHISFSRHAGRCGDGMSQYRRGAGLPLESLLASNILHEGRTDAERIARWNERCVSAIDDYTRDQWGESAFSRRVVLVSG